MQPRLSAVLFALALAAPACQPEDDGAAPPGAMPMPMVPAQPPAVVVVLDQKLAIPRDLAFNPLKPAQLWVVNRNGYVAIVDGATDPATAQLQSRRDRDANHFMALPTALAFGADFTNPNTPNPALRPGTFATCGESRNAGPNSTALGNDFMGPVLWSSDLAVFAVMNGMLGSHLDMLHQSPLCMGIAWEGQGNVYWAFNGLARSIDRYDFKLDHGFGNDNHDDGLIFRFIPGQLGYVTEVPSHVFYEASEAAVYVADTGNRRILRLSYESARQAGRLERPLDEAGSFLMTGETLREVVPAASGQLTRPSGIELHKGALYVSDNATSEIVRFTPQGQLVARYRTSLAAGSLAGMAFGPDDKLYFVDMLGNRVLRFDGPI